MPVFENNHFIKTFEVTVKGETYTLDPTKELLIDASDLKQELITQPAKYAFWSSLASELQMAADLAKHQEDTVYAQVDQQTRASLSAAGQKATEKMVENSVITHPQYVDAKRGYLQAQNMANQMKNFSIAFYNRFHSLNELSQRERGENFALHKTGNADFDYNPTKQ